jgi:hypothetical protein
MPAHETTETTETTQTLTEALITGLRTAAAAAGDTDQVLICDAALGGDDASREACALAITAARAMDDDTPLVRVVADTCTPERAVLHVLALSGAAMSQDPTESLRIVVDAFDHDVRGLGDGEFGWRLDLLLRRLYAVIGRDRAWAEFLDGDAVDIAPLVWDMLTGEIVGL